MKKIGFLENSEKAIKKENDYLKNDLAVSKKEIETIKKKN